MEEISKKEQKDQQNGYKAKKEASSKPFLFSLSFLLELFHLLWI